MSRRREYPSLRNPLGQFDGHENSFMWKRVGNTNARAVLKSAPMRAMKSPKEGMASARASASATSEERNTVLFHMTARTCVASLPFASASPNRVSSRTVTGYMFNG